MDGTMVVTSGVGVTTSDTGDMGVSSAWGHMGRWCTGLDGCQG